MKYFTFLFLFISFNVYSQADLTIDLFLHDSYTPPFGGDQIVSFGLDSIATDGIDPQLGEWIVPIDACPGLWPVFCAKFILPPFDYIITSINDFRFGVPPYNCQITHMINIFTVDDSISMHYNLPSGVSIHIIDPNGGIFINFTIEDSGEIVMPSTDYGLWMYVTYDNVIPVEIASFTGWFVEQNNSVELSWKTISEINSKGFNIERKIVGHLDNSSCNCGPRSEWIKIGYVPGYGTTTEPKTYSFTDENVTSGIYKYRLKQIDFDGSFKYSKEIEVEVNLIPAKFTLEQNYPNPFNPMTRIKFGLPEAADVSLIIFNSLGQKVTELVKAKLDAGSYEYQWNAKIFASGIYIYELRAEKFYSIRKMVLLK